MEHDEVAGLLAHELAHVKNRDILIGSIAATMAGAIMVLASMARWSSIFRGAGGGDERGGGAGFIGSNVVGLVCRSGGRVMVLDDLSAMFRQSVEEFGGRHAKEPRLLHS